MVLYFLAALSSYCSLRKEPFVDLGKLQSFYSKERKAGSEDRTSLCKTLRRNETTLE